MTNVFATEMTARVSHEEAKSNDKLTADNLLKLKRAAALFSNDSVAELLSAASVDAATLNRATRADKRFALYSIDKAVNVLQFVLSSSKLNDMNFYILKTAIACSAANVDMTLADVKAACSASIKVDKSRKSLVVQNAKHIAESTVKAQHASTLDALLFLNVLSASRDKMNNDTFTLNRESAIAAKLIERLS